MTRLEFAYGKSLLRVPQTCPAIDAACANALEMVLQTISPKNGFSSQQARRLRGTIAPIITGQLAEAMKDQTRALRHELVVDIMKGIPE